MAAITPQRNFKVIIVGGSVSGLTLAHCLDRLCIDFEVLEQHTEIAPQLGASLGILPNGARILDQLGLFSDIEEQTEPLKLARIRYLDGFCFESQYPTALHQRFGYPLSFLERKSFLQILYDKLHRKDRVHNDRKVVSIEDDGRRILVHTSDGGCYSGDLVVGADGMHSIVRSEMWRIANQCSPNTFSREDRSSLRCKYACIYGISLDVPQVAEGVQRSLLDEGLTIHLINGKGSKVFWFLIYEVSRYHGSKEPSFQSSKAREICDDLRSKKVDENVLFGDIWSRCSVYKLTPLDEGMFKRYHYGRMLCIGDAIRKMAPNIGQGANMAIEDAACLANLLSGTLLLTGNVASWAEIDALLSEFTMQRQKRTKAICDQSEFLVRMQANADIWKRMIGRYLIPLLSDAPAGLSGLTIEGAEKLNFLEIPGRASMVRSQGFIVKYFGTLRFFRPKIGVGCFLIIFVLLSGIVTKF